MEKSEFYTLQGYRMKNHPSLTASMEDYLEMIYRISKEQFSITVKHLADSLNVKPSSVSKMCARLKKEDLIQFERYGTIYLTEKGVSIGEYLLWRHELLESLFKMISEDKFQLEQVEKVEHFIDTDTLKHIEHFLKSAKKSN